MVLAAEGQLRLEAHWVGYLLVALSFGSEPDSGSGTGLDPGDRTEGH